MSRDDPTYSRVSSKFWAGAADEGWTDDMALLGMYLLTCQARTTEGLYRLPKGYMAEDLPGEWPMERLTESLARLVANGFVDYDEKARVVFLPKAMKYQRPDNTNQQTSAIRNLKNLPQTRLWSPFLEAAKAYCEAFHKRLREAFPQGLAQGLPQAIPQGDGDSLLSSISTQQPLSACAREDDGQPVENDGDKSGEVTSDHQESANAPLPADDATDSGTACEPGSANPGEAAASDSAATCLLGTCDGAECAVQGFAATAYDPLRRVVLKSLHPEQWQEIGKADGLGAASNDYAAVVCVACQASFAEFERPQRDGLCERALIAAVESLDGSQDVTKVMRSRAGRGLAELIGDRKLEELRRSTRDPRRSGEPKPLSDCLPPPFAAPMPRPGEEGAA